MIIAVFGAMSASLILRGDKPVTGEGEKMILRTLDRLTYYSRKKGDSSRPIGEDLRVSDRPRIFARKSSGPPYSIKP